MIPCLSLVEPSVVQVKAKIIDLATAESEFVAGLARYALRTSGQMLRPSLVLITSLLSGSATPPRQAVDLGALAELVHCASLLHDDVVDAGRVRRQLTTVNAQWGNKEAVLLGDFVLALALEILSEFPDKRVLKSVRRITHKLALGELQELERVRDLAVTEDSYLRIISNKTAHFFGECCYLGGWAAGLDDGDLDTLSRLGVSLGMAYQILDDLLDVSASLTDLGKDTTLDVVNGNITLPILHTLSAQGLPGPRERLRRAFEDRDVEYLRAHLFELVHEGGGYEYASRRARAYADEARGHLAALGPNRPTVAIQALSGLIDYIFERFERGGAARPLARPAALVGAAASGR